VINSIRAHLAEFGIVAPVGRKGVTELLRVVADPNDGRVPEVARACLAALGCSTAQPEAADFGVRSDDHGLAPIQSNEQAPSLHSPGVGPMLATALVASVVDPRTFRSGRNFSAWIGLVPKQHSSGGKDRLGSISKQGDRYLCAACSSPGHSPSFATPRSTERGIGPGSRRCWHGVRPRSPLSHLPTRLREWPGP